MLQIPCDSFNCSSSFQMAIRFVRESPEQKRHFQPTMLQLPQAWQLELQNAANSKENDRTAENPKKTNKPGNINPQSIPHCNKGDGSCCANTFKFWTGFCRCPPRKKKALRRKAITRVPHSIRLESCMQQARYGVVLARPSGSMFEGPR